VPITGSVGAFSFVYVLSAILIATPVSVATHSPGIGLLVGGLVWAVGYFASKNKQSSP
jgi:hypothetical protein